jgi:S-formylglutathione hydrolase FrmB
MAYIKLYFNTDTTATKSGISGHSMGGYGAYRLAIRHPELFGSVSAMSAPVVFDGLKALLPAVYAENNYPPVDTAGQVDSTLLDSAFYAINPSAGRISAMMFAMAAAFSPHSLTNPDTSLFHRLVRTAGFVGVDLPFDVDTTFNDSLWENYWLPNDPMTMLMTGGDDSLTGKSLYLDCGNVDDLGLFLQNRAFKDALTAAGLSAVYYEYSGYGNDDGDHTTFISDRLREVMKFHSRAFSAQ